MTIQKRALDRFLTGSLLPLFGEAWRVYGGDCILRIEGLLIQGIWMSCSAYDDKFCPAYSINVLPQPHDILHGTLGSRLKNSRGGDMWLAWQPEKEGFADELMRAVQEQTKPRIGEPLTLEAVGDYIVQYHLKHRHFTALWSLGIVRGLLGDLRGAVKYLEAVQEDFQEGLRNWEARGKPAPLYLNEYINRVTILRNQLLDSATFAAYCAQEGARIKKALKLPE